VAALVPKERTIYSGKEDIMDYPTGIKRLREASEDKVRK
jgi:hypothetical protein